MAVVLAVAVGLGTLALLLIAAAMLSLAWRAVRVEAQMRNGPSADELEALGRAVRTLAEDMRDMEDRVTHRLDRWSKRLREKKLPEDGVGDTNGEGQGVEVPLTLTEARRRARVKRAGGLEG